MLSAWRLAAEIKAGNLNFDVVIASPDAMRIVGQLGTILGPRGLMPNPKVGTVTPNVAEAVKNAKLVRYNIVQTKLVSFMQLSVVLRSLKPIWKKNFVRCWMLSLKLKPAAAKGQ